MARKQQLDFFSRFTSRFSLILGHASAFVVALSLLIVWAVSGPLFHFSTTWQLLINTGTTIITFLMVFIIQNTQNRDNLAMNIKLDAIMKKMGVTNADLLDAEDLSEAALEKKLTYMQRQTKAKASTKSAVKRAAS